MTAAQPEAGRIRARRELFQRALRDNVTLAEAQRRAAAERWAVTDASLAKRRAGAVEDEGRPLAWWQQ